MNTVNNVLNICLIMISLKLANICKIKFNESIKPFRLADGTLSKRFYGTKNLVTVKVKETKCKLN